MEDKDNFESCDDLTKTNEESSSEITTDTLVSGTEKLPSKTESKGKEDKYELSLEFRQKLEQFPEILDFIKMLQKCIEKQKKKLKKYKKEKVKKKSVATQTNQESIKNGCTIEAKPNLTKSVTEEITEAAQQALHTNGFVYEETSGLYYDYNSGYYYNAEYGLYYDGNSGTYLKYNQDTKEYEFHSQTEGIEVQHTKHTKRKSKKRQKSKQDEPHVIKTSISNLDELTMSFDSLRVSAYRRRGCDVSKQYPPCMRIIIEETAIPSLKPGSLHLITFEGGSIGREGGHALLLPEINTSKHHAKITYDSEKNSYFLTDIGSRNGTLLNGKRVSPAKVESEPMEIPHGSRVQIGSTILLCHVHNGNQTCGHCEPGLLKNLQTKEPTTEEEVKNTKSIDHKHQLKQLRKKFGLTQNDQGKTAPGAGYKDRALQRRVTVGSQNPHEKTQTASLTESIASNNKGFKLLSKMGWKEGQALGKDNQGRLEPIELLSNPGTSGMGSTSDTKVIQPSTIVQPKNPKKNVWTKAQERYNQAQAPDDIFDLSDL